MGQTFSEPNSVSQNPDEQIPKEEAKNGGVADQLKNGGDPNSVSQNPEEQIPEEEASDRVKNSREADRLKNAGEADQLKNGGEGDQLKNGGEAGQLKNGGEAEQTNGRDTEAARGEEGGEEEEGECGFCLWMKGGGCRDRFIEWENCVKEAEENKEDVVEKCFQITSNLKNCMEANAEYYEPILKAEKAAEEQVTKELESEAANKSEEQTAASDSTA